MTRIFIIVCLAVLLTLAVGTVRPHGAPTAGPCTKQVNYSATVYEGTYFDIRVPASKCVSRYDATLDRSIQINQ